MRETENAAFDANDAAMMCHSFSCALPPGEALTVGNFRYDVASDGWHWSSGTYNIHGFELGEIVPTTRLVLAHKHPEDRDAFERLFQQVRTRGGTAVSHHRILDGRGRTRHVVMIAEAVKAADCSIATVNGYYLDLSAVMDAQGSAMADEAVARAVEKRHIIEQAKGILMCRFKVDSDAAFGMLAQASQRTQRKLRIVAEELVDSFQSDAVKSVANRPPSDAQP